MHFKDLDGKKLNQDIRKVRGMLRRLKIDHVTLWLTVYGEREYVDRTEGIEYLGFTLSGGCKHYAIGDADIMDIVPGVLEHDGNPESGDIIIYGHGLARPTHVGVWQDDGWKDDGVVISKWGNYGPVMKHSWDNVPSKYGRCAFFTKYKGRSTEQLLAHLE